MLIIRMIVCIAIVMMMVMINGCHHHEHCEK